MRGVGTIVRCEGRAGWRVFPHDTAAPSFVRRDLEVAKRDAERSAAAGVSSLDRSKGN